MCTAQISFMPLFRRLDRIAAAYTTDLRSCAASFENRKASASNQSRGSLHMAGARLRNSHCHYRLGQAA
jgi:hypothetical protein